MSTTISGDTGIDKVQAGTPITASSIMGALNATGTAPIYACRAWVNFNGTGTVAIRASGNVSSITDNGVGDYTVNFTTAMPDTNASIAGMGMYNAAVSAAAEFAGRLTTVSTLLVTTAQAQNGAFQDNEFISAQVFR